MVTDLVGIILLTGAAYGLWRAGRSETLRGIAGFAWTRVVVLACLAGFVGGVQLRLVWTGRVEGLAESGAVIVTLAACIAFVEFAIRDAYLGILRARARRFAHPHTA